MKTMSVARFTEVVNSRDALLERTLWNDRQK